MALKYWFEFTDIKTIIHRVEILSSDFNGESTQIFGSCYLEYSETDDTLEAIRGSGLKIDLEANSDLTFSDLYSEEERTFRVVYTRDSEILFNGWLSPEGIYESLVSDKWIISLDCVDGLGFLTNLSYVEDATGLNFIGKQSLLEIVVNCLKRTKTPQDILIYISIFYDGWSPSIDTFDSVYFNANRFVKDDASPTGKDGTIMNCEEVLKSVLEPFGAVLTSYKGEWVIYKPNNLANNSSINFFSYDNLGVANSPYKKTIDFSLALGSQINDYYPHHVNANQQKTIKSSVGAYRINYKYGEINYFLNNNFVLILSSSGQATRSSDEFRVSQSDKVNYVFKSRFEIEGNFFPTSLKLYVIVREGNNNYYYNGDVWVQGTSKPIELTNNNDFTINLPPAPIDGDFLSFLTVTGGTTSIGSLAVVGYWQAFPSSSDVDVKGENHTFQRILKPSSKIQETKDIFNGDEETDSYLGTIYKANKTTPTEKWKRSGQSDIKPLLQIMGEERMKMYSKPLQVYSGDVYGFFDYLSVFTINGLIGKFQPTKYSYDALRNITTLELTEILDSDIISDILYEKTFDYGNVVEPTIKG
jgi:hypothetical protein